MTRGALSVLLLALTAQAVTASGGPRIRKELRTLSPEELRALVLGLSTMATVSTDSGRRLFGPDFISWSDVVVKHAVAVHDPRGDQGHTGPAFMTFHRAFLLEIENSLLAVVPSLGALPYWDVTLDRPGGKYWGTDNFIFSPKYAGSMEGDNAVGHGVTTGIFAWRQVPRYIPAQFPPAWAEVFSGTETGYMRSKGNKNANPLVTRHPTAGLIKAVNDGSVGGVTAFLPPFNRTGLKDAVLTEQYLRQVGGQWAIDFPPGNFSRCLDPASYRDWQEWGFCADVAILSATQESADTMQRYVGPQAGVSALLHTAAHWAVGSVSLNDTADVGDMYDVTTSPNELLLFPLHHANVDRSALTWQHAAAAARPSLVAASWGYPTAATPTVVVNPGCRLHDVINSVAGFTRLFDTPPKNGSGYTHAEVLALTAPGKSPYLYDSQVEAH